MGSMPEVDNNLRRALNDCINNAREFRSDIENQDIIVYVGLTRSGKTTLFKCVTGTPLKAIRHHLTYKIIAANDTQDTIAQGSVTSTLTPSVNEDSRNSIVVDLSSFFNNRGPLGDITAAVFLSQIQHANSCKFVFVSDVNSILSDEKSNFLKPLAELVELIPADISQSISFMFTKVNERLTRQDIIAILKEEIINQRLLNMSEGVRSLLRSITGRTISFFRLPSREGALVNDQLLDGYWDAIDESDAFSMNGIIPNLCISAETRLLLMSTFATYVDNLDLNQVVPFTTMINRYCEPQYIFASFDSELTDIQNDLVRYTNRLEYELHIQFRRIQQVSESVYRLRDNDRTHEFFNWMSFYIDLEGITNINSQYTRALFQKYRDWIVQLRRRVDALGVNISSEQNHRLDMNFQFTLEASALGVAACVAGGIGVRTAIVEAIPASIPVAAPVVAAVVAAAGGATVATIIQLKRERGRRINARRQQGRPVN